IEVLDTNSDPAAPERHPGPQTGGPQGPVPPRWNQAHEHSVGGHHHRIRHPDQDGPGGDEDPNQGRHA
ncbi:hypothetical protein RZS08_62470, partial [Arthrospira platensis SPKY1]|nr:hypothetical protein [Arthrospira platensis SPKY1]